MKIAAVREGCTPPVQRGGSPGRARLMGEGVDLERFRRLVVGEFGDSLERATPANVREFLASLDLENLEAVRRGALVLDEDTSTFEEATKVYFRSVLDMPADKAVVRMWALAFELSFAVIETHEGERLSRLFDEPDPD